VTTALNDYLDFPQLGQAFMVERITFHKKTAKQTRDVAYGITSKAPNRASPAQVLRDNREHWSIENSCHYIIDWNDDEDRSRICKGHGPENMTRLRRFAVGLIKSKGVRSVAQRMRELTARHHANACFFEISSIRNFFWFPVLTHFSANIAASDRPVLVTSIYKSLYFVFIVIE